jgi:hypothetical protein
VKSTRHAYYIPTLLILTLASCSLNPHEPASPANASPLKATLEPSQILPEDPDQGESQCENPFGTTAPAFRTNGWETNFCLHSVPFDEIFSGGPPRDGIPPIDSPRFESVASADSWIDDPEPVILLDHKGETRAYPLQILIWHEIVNDQIGGEPVAVTFCPLCNTALVYLRPIVDGTPLSFGTSGNLRNSDLVMWDRQTESWWQQFNGEAIVGDLTGTRLVPLPAAIISWSDFKSSHPDGQVLSKETGYTRSYGRNPYPGYDNVNNLPFAFSGNPDGELPPMARVVGITLPGDQGAAYPRDLIEENQVLNETIAGQPVVILWKPGTASALDSASIPDGRDIGTTAVFDRTIDGEVLTFSANGDGTYTDLETGSSWDILGSAQEGPLAGSQLIPLPYHDTFWFAWAAFVPDGNLIQ